MAERSSVMPAQAEVVQLRPARVGGLFRMACLDMTLTAPEFFGECEYLTHSDAQERVAVGVPEAALDLVELLIRLVCPEPTQRCSSTCVPGAGLPCTCRTGRVGRMVVQLASPRPSVSTCEDMPRTRLTGRQAKDITNSL